MKAKHSHALTVAITLHGKDIFKYIYNQFIKDKHFIAHSVIINIKRKVIFTKANVALCARQPRTQLPNQAHVSSSALRDADNRLQFAGVRAWASSDTMRRRKTSRRTSRTSPSWSPGAASGTLVIRDPRSWTSRPRSVGSIVCAIFSYIVFLEFKLCMK